MLLFNRGSFTIPRVAKLPLFLNFRFTCESNLNRLVEDKGLFKIHIKTELGHVRSSVYSDTFFYHQISS